MNYGNARAFRHALEQRLKNQAGQDNVRLAKLRKVITFDRLLARLITVSPDRWVLKGAFALDLRYGGDVRTTKDLAEFLNPVLSGQVPDEANWNPEIRA